MQISPLFAIFQDVPLLIDLKTPALVPAKIVDPLTAKDCTPLFKSDDNHEAPLFADRNTPFPAPAKIFVPLNTIEDT